MIALGFDTSNYTTSVAWFDGEKGENVSRLLTVKPGEMGLRQSEALFQHGKNLPEVMERLMETLPQEGVSAIGASYAPRPVQGSYMPCFQAGVSHGLTTSCVMRVPYYGFSHQEGHLAAVLYSSGRVDLLDKPFLAWHLSGGTTELLFVHPTLSPEIIGGTEDLSAGQLIDRTGKLLGLDFPAGKELDALAQRGSAAPFAVKVRNMRFSLSGMQNKARDMAGKGREHVARFVIECLIHAIRLATEQAKEMYGDMPVVFTGGVSSNLLLREAMTPLGGIFGAPAYSTDNAMGIAVRTWMLDSKRPRRDIRTL